ncbi:MAG: hypothetical protein WDA27_00160 [Actinomycetota bacterium]
MSANRKAAIGAGVAVLVAVAALAATRLGGDAGPQALEPIRAPRAVLAVPSASASPQVSASPVPRTAEAFEGKDPFQPLVEPTAAAGTSSPTPGPTAVSTSQTQSRRVTLLDIFSDHDELVATVRVADAEYSVAAGETFADNFKLLSLTSRCGTFVFGDERFTLCIGQEARK